MVGNNRGTGTVRKMRTSYHLRNYSKKLRTIRYFTIPFICFQRRTNQRLSELGSQVDLGLNYITCGRKLYQESKDTIETIK